MTMTLQGVLTSVPDMSKLVDKLSWAIAPFAFIEQLTEKERATGILSANRPIQENAARIIDIISGRVAGVSLLGIVKAPRTFKIRRFILNKWMGFWLIGEIANIVIGAIVPAANKILGPVVKITRIAVIPGSVGAVFDDPAPKKTGSHSSSGFENARDLGAIDLSSKSLAMEHMFISGGR